MVTPTDLPDVLTVQEFAKWARIGRRQAYEAVARGDVPSVRIGKTIRIPVGALKDHLQEHGECRHDPSFLPGYGPVIICYCGWAERFIREGDTEGNERN